MLAVAPALIVLLLLSLVWLESAAAQNAALIPLEATINQNAVMRQEISPPPTRQRSLRGRLGEPIAGVPPEKLAETRFTLTAVDFVGPSDLPLDPGVFAPAWQGLIGKEITLRELGTVLESIEDIYRQRDYVVIAKVPAQDFASGRIRIVAYTVYITEIDVKGDVGRLGARLDPILARLKAMHPLRQSAIYRQLLIAEDLVSGEINVEWFQIESAPGAARLELVIASKPGNLLLGLDNYGGANIGPLQAAAKARVNDIFGLFESTDITALANPANPARLAYLGFAQTVPLGTTGFSFGYGVANSWSNPGGPSLDVRLHSELLIANVGINYSLLREMERNVIVTAALNGNNSSVDELGEPLTRDRTRWVSVGAKYDDVIGGVRIVLNPVFQHGVDAFQANVPFDDFQVAILNGGATTNLTETLSVQLLFTGQYAFGTLPAAVLGFYGGEVFGRAYDPGALAGNNLVAASLQVTQQIDTGLRWLPELSLFAFADHGAAWNPAGSPYEFASLSSAGFGLRVGIGERLVATGLVAQPLTYEPQLAAVGVEQGMRLRFTVGLRF
jgi:hemolysin activation/secretion protein